MAITNFYKLKGSYYTEKGDKILNPTDLQNYAKAGGKEISAPTAPQGSTAIPNPQAIPNYNVTANIGGTLYGTPKNPISSDVVTAGIQSPSLNLPSSNDRAMGIYTDNSLKSATEQQKSLQAELDALKAQRIQENQDALKAEQDNLKNIQGQQDQQIAGYDAQFNPLKDKAVGIYDSMLNSIKDTNYSELTKQKLELTNDIISYSKMMREELDTAAERPGIASISNARQNAIKENYTSKIAVAQAAQSAIDGNFTLAFDIMDKGANAIERLTNDRINFINSVKSIFSTKENMAISEVLRLTGEESKLLDQAVSDAEAKLSNIQKNKETIMELMKTSPIVANKAGLLLTDTPEQLATKLNDFYVANPQYTPDNQEAIKNAMEQYPDAGISLSDSIATVQKKVQSSRIYQKEAGVVAGGPAGGSSGGSLLDAGTWGGQCGDYVHKIVDNVPALGNTYEEKMARANISTKDWKVGDVLIQKTRLPYGHVSVVTAVNGDSVTVTESNWNLDEKVGTRVIKKGDPSITGVYRGGIMKAIAPTPQQGFSDTALAYAKDILSGKIKIENVPGENMKNEVILAKAELEKTQKPLSDQLIAEGLQDKIDGLNYALGSSGMKGTVGSHSWTRWTPLAPDKAERQDFIATVEQLIQQETIDKLVQSKAAGATYGALSEGEREMLSKAASKIGTWRILDKSGKVIGYEISESLMKKELNTIKELAQKAKDRILGDSVIVPPDQLSDDDAWLIFQSIKK